MRSGLGPAPDPASVATRRFPSASPPAAIRRSRRYACTASRNAHPTASRSIRRASRTRTTAGNAESSGRAASTERRARGHRRPPGFAPRVRPCRPRRLCPDASDRSIPHRDNGRRRAARRRRPRSSRRRKALRQSARRRTIRARGSALSHRAETRPRQSDSDSRAGTRVEYRAILCRRYVPRARAWRSSKSLRARTAASPAARADSARFPSVAA